MAYAYACRRVCGDFEEMADDVRECVLEVYQPLGSDSSVPPENAADAVAMFLTSAREVRGNFAEPHPISALPSPLTAALRGSPLRGGRRGHPVTPAARRGRLVSPGSPVRGCPFRASREERPKATPVLPVVREPLRAGTAGCFRGAREPAQRGGRGAESAGKGDGEG
ncbi:MAG: hypothetical protein BJ554DRAFT_5323 [Olpidium bornovanus]|uniref:Uncharacterized protein n=1 Tax=Olpidium bornovanus TaxID=278681 RepID=A0A8H7ZZU4_9FUNG|nr:MAG: hypothetical protein BJ554DRAFT_5323 [Olpidium bornovanus]